MERFASSIQAEVTRLRGSSISLAAEVARTRERLAHLERVNALVALQDVANRLGRLEEQLAASRSDGPPRETGP